MSERKNSYRGPAITLGLAATLIAALALPYYVGSPSPASTAMSLRSAAAGYVADVQVGVGQVVQKGDVLVRLSDTDLQAQIAQAQHELNILLGSSKTAVAEPILGGIGTVPRVVMIPVKDENPLPAEPIASAPSKPVADPTLAAAKKQLASTQDEIAKAETPGLQAQLDDAKGLLSASQEALASAQAAQAVALKESDRMQKLFDMGAVAKRRSDAAKLTLESSNTEVTTQQERVNEAQAKVSDLQKQIDGAAARLETLKAKLAELNAKIAELSKKADTPAPTPAAPAHEAPKFVRKVVMSSAPIGSTAPLSVKLVDSEDPALQKKIDEAKAKLEALKTKLADLEIKAPFAGIVAKVLVKPGDAVTAASILVQVEAR